MFLLKCIPTFQYIFYRPIYITPYYYYKIYHTVYKNILDCDIVTLTTEYIRISLLPRPACNKFYCVQFSTYTLNMQLGRHDVHIYNFIYVYILDLYHNYINYIIIREI